MWVWIAIAAGGMFVLAALASLALGTILGTIGREIGELFETELWRTAPQAAAMVPPALEKTR